MLKIVNRTLIEEVYSHKVILVPMGITNSMNNGFAYEIGLNFPEVRKMFGQYQYGDKRKYGHIYCIKHEDIIFCACYMHKGGYRNGYEDSFIDYDALKSCLREVNDNFPTQDIATPILGVTEYDGKGEKDRILAIFEEFCRNSNITIFDYDQRDYRLELYHEIAGLHNDFVDKKISPEEFMKKRSEMEWRRKNGIFKEKPEDYVYLPKNCRKNKLIPVKKIDLKK